MKRSIITGISLGAVAGIIDSNDYPEINVGCQHFGISNVDCDWIYFINHRTKDEFDTQRDSDIISGIAACCNTYWLERTSIACSNLNHDNNLRWCTWLFNSAI